MSDAGKTKKEVPQVDFEKLLISRMKEFEERLNLVQKENKLLNEQIQKKERLGQEPLAYVDGKQDSKIASPNILPSYSEKLLKAMEEDDKIVEGKFEYKEITRPKEAKGATVSFHFRKYPGKPVQRYTLVHNNIYKLPMGVAKHINGELGGCKYAIHKHVMDEATGEQRIDSQETVHRLGFHSTQYM